MAFVTNVDDDDPTILSEVNVNITFLTWNPTLTSIYNDT